MSQLFAMSRTFKLIKEQLREGKKALIKNRIKCAKRGHVWGSEELDTDRTNKPIIFCKGCGAWKPGRCPTFHTPYSLYGEHHTLGYGYYVPSCECAKRHERCDHVYVPKWVPCTFTDWKQRQQKQFEAEMYSAYNATHYRCVFCHRIHHDHINLSSKTC